MRWLLCVFTVFLFVGGTGWAQTADPGDSADRTAILLARIEALERRTAELEARVCSSTDPGNSDLVLTAAVAPVALVPTSVHQAVPVEGDHQAMTPAAPDDYPSLKLHGFADVGFSAVQHAVSGFTLGQFVLHISSALSPRVSFLGETSFTPRSNAAVQATPIGFNLEVERAIIRFDHSDAFKLSFGRYHTPISYWNTAFHHGLWLQTTISRPEMIQFGSSFLPVHFVGMLAEGNLSLGGKAVGYNFGLGNGRSSILSRAGDPGDVNSNRAWVAGIGTRPTGSHGFQVGAAVYRDRISTGRQPDFGEWITSAHMVLTRETPEIVAEYANVRHRNLATGESFDSHGYYLQLAYRLPWQAQRWKPYYRFDGIHLPSGEPVFPMPDFLGSTVGLRYDVSSYAALKGEIRHSQRGTAQPRVNGVFFQTSLTF